MNIEKIKKYLLGSVLVVTFAAFSFGFTEFSANAASPVKAKHTNSQTLQQTAISTTPLAIVCSPNKYLGHYVKFNATFDKFSTLGLDYKPALKKSQDFIGILIRRDDVTDHVVPLSEMKIFLSRKVAEKYIDLESGDRIQIQGKVFSNALGDPWIEITQFTVTKKSKANTTK